MSLIKSVSKSLFDSPITVEQVIPSTWRGNSFGSNDGFFWGNDGSETHFVFADHNSSLKAFEKCPPLTAIINKQAQSFTKSKTWVMNTAGKAKGKEATSEEAKKIRKLFLEPNPLQSGREFKAQRFIYKKIFGYSLALPIIPAGYEKYGLIEATSIWNIPPYMVDIQETNKLFYQSDLKGIIKQIVLNYKGVRSVLNLDNLIIFKDFTPSMSSLIFPETRIKALAKPISNIIGAYESLGEQINYAGAQGIFSASSDANGPIPIKEEDKIALQKDFARYGLRKGQWKYIFAPTKVEWQQVGRPVRDQMYLEQIEDAIQRICDGYNHPYKLVSNNYGGGLGANEVTTATRNLYEDAIIPEAESECELWNKYFKTDELGIIIEEDFSHIAALQLDQKDAAAARLTRNNAYRIEFFTNLIPLNRWNELNGEDAIPALDVDGVSVDIGKMYYFQLVAIGIKFGSLGSHSAQNQNTDGTEQQQSTGQQGQGNQA